jgi:glutamate synthase (NADPH/NADH) small chain
MKNVTDRPVKNSRYLQEVEPIYRSHQARLEASRCLFCHDAPCARACPAEIDVAGFIRRLKEGNVAGAAQLIYQANVLGGSCGRVCPVEMLCQEACSHTELSDPIKIGRLQAYAWQRGYDQLDVRTPSGEGLGKVAVVGAGPAGLAAAAELARLGYQVTVFESGDRAGGVLSSGIPGYRLPEEVLKGELDLIRRLGVKFAWGREVGQNLSLDDLRSQGFEAVFLGLGLGRSARVGLPGEDLEGVFWAADLLARIKNDPAGRRALAAQLGRRVVVIGGGNVAIDVACSLLRLGVEKVSLVCLEGPREMPAFPSEVRFALDEGVELHTRCRPLRILGDDVGHVIGLEGIGIRWKRPDCFIPENAVSIPGTEFGLQADSIVEAIGQRPDQAVLEALQLERTPEGLICIDEMTGQTSQAMVFAAGDAVNGGATVVQAVAGGKRAARGIHRYFQEKK